MSSEERLDNDPNDEGINPVREFLDRSRTERFDNWPKVDGMVPVRELSDRYNSWRLDKFPRVEGIAPEIWQNLRSRTWSVWSWSPNPLGIEPGRVNREALKDTKLVKFASESTANWGFFLPARVRLNPEMLIPVTLPFWHEIPTQLKHGIDFIGHCCDLNPNDDLSWSRAARSALNLVATDGGCCCCSNVLWNNNDSTNNTTKLLPMTTIFQDEKPLSSCALTFSSIVNKNGNAKLRSKIRDSPRFMMRNTLVIPWIDHKTSEISILRNERKEQQSFSLSLSLSLAFLSVPTVDEREREKVFKNKKMEVKRRDN